MSSDSNSPSLDIYKDICNNIRVTDEISFKLLGIVPLASGVGAGALTILEKSKLLPGNTYPALVVAALSTLGALITMGLFRWELRNIQKCLWLISRAAKFETNVLRENWQFAGIAREEDLRATKIEEVRVPFLFKIPLDRWTKAQSEQLIYLASIGSWLVPLGIAIYRLVSNAPQ